MSEISKWGDGMWEGRSGGFNSTRSLRDPRLRTFLHLMALLSETPGLGGDERRKGETG